MCVTPGVSAAAEQTERWFWRGVVARTTAGADACTVRHRRGHVNLADDGCEPGRGGAAPSATAPFYPDARFGAAVPAETPQAPSWSHPCLTTTPVRTDKQYAEIVQGSRVERKTFRRRTASAILPSLLIARRYLQRVCTVIVSARRQPRFSAATPRPRILK